MSFPNMAHLASHRYWTVASSFFIGSVAISACVLGYLLWKEISKPQPERFDISGAFYDVGYEFNRFLISAERNESPEKIRLRADIYLSRVIHFRDAPIYERVRALMPEQQLSELFQSIDEIAALVENLYRPGGRDALLAYLRPGEKPMRAMIVQIAARDREIWIAGQAARQGVMTRYIALIVVLLVAFVIARIVIGAKLRDAGRAIAAQLVTREGILGSVDGLSNILSVKSNRRLEGCDPVSC